MSSTGISNPRFILRKTIVHAGMKEYVLRASV